MNPRGNPQNFRVLTSDEARKQGRKGGLKSGEVRRQRKSLQEIATAVLSMPLEPGEIVDIDDETLSLAGIEGENMTIGLAMILAQVKKALDGDTYALRCLIETAGEKPVERVEVQADIAEASREIGKLIEEMQEKERRKEQLIEEWVPPDTLAELKTW